jgi:hypothetical protein
MQSTLLLSRRPAAAAAPRGLRSARPARQRVTPVRAMDDTNVFINLIGSAAAGAIATGELFFFLYCKGLRGEEEAFPLRRPLPHPLTSPSTSPTPLSPLSVTPFYYYKQA